MLLIVRAYKRQAFNGGGKSLDLPAMDVTFSNKLNIETPD